MAIDKDLKGRLLANIPYDFYGVKLHPFLVKDIFKMGVQHFITITQPYTLTKEFFGAKGDIMDKIPLFELLVAIDPIREALKDSLVCLFKLRPTEIRFVGDMESLESYFIIKNKLIINHLKFEELKQQVLIMCCAKELKEQPKQMDFNRVKDAKRRKALEKLMENRKANKDIIAEEQTVELTNIYNTVVHSQPSIDYEKVANFNIYQLYNSFQAINVRQDYEYNLKIATSGQCSDVNKLDLTPFATRLAKLGLKQD